MTREKYDEICRVLTWYEHPEESLFEEEVIIDWMYELLVQLVNESDYT